MASSAPQRITVVVPTYREVENLPHLIDRVGEVRDKHGLEIDMLIMDDNSNDGSVELVRTRAEKWVRIMVRTKDRGLSQAVLEGLQVAQGNVLVCMDADLSHPPETLPAMLKKLAEGADFVLGSRYVAGGTTADDWGFLRWLNSRVATLLARPLTNVRDPMSGFFAIPRPAFTGGRDFNPTGYKIALELIVKCRCERVVEVPIRFENRRFGESKLTLTQQLLYLQHLRRLYIYKFGVWSQLMQFLIVGAMGTAVNLAALTLFLSAGITVKLAVALAIFVAMSFNFILNRRFSFSFARDGFWLSQYLRFAGASSVAAVVNYLITLLILNHTSGWRPQVAALIGIAVGTAFNFVASRYLVFRSRYVRVDSGEE
jgi:dolichol-phosphate mannosyltransferase